MVAALFERVWKIVLAAAAVVGLIASVAQIAQVFRDGDYSLLAICVIGLCDAVLVIFLVLIIRDRRAAKSSGGLRADAPPIVVISGILVLTIVGLVISLVNGAGSTQTPTTTSTLLPSANTASSTRPSGLANCVDESGGSAACDAASSYLVTKVSPCTADAALRQFSIDPEEQQLDLEAQPGASGCLLRPGPTSHAEGATASDVVRLRDGIVATRFRLCLTTNEGPVVACSKPHFTELVSPSKGADILSDVSSCLQPARRYTGRTLSDPFGELQAVLLESPSDRGATYRCGVRSTLKLNDTIWQVGTAPLPTA